MRGKDAISKLKDELSNERQSRAEVEAETYASLEAEVVLSQQKDASMAEMVLSLNAKDSECNSLKSQIEKMTESLVSQKK